jgi:hypothetical protein
MSRKVMKLLTVDLDLTKPFWKKFSLDFKEHETWACVINSKASRKNVENSYGSIIFNRRSSSFSKTGTIDACLYKL